MESDDDFELLPSSPVHERKLKRLKKATSATEYPRPSMSPNNFSELENDTQSEESNGGSVPEPESLGDDNVTVEEDGLGARRVLDFDSVGEELDGKVTEEKSEEEIRDLKTDELERKRRSIDPSPEKKEKKKKKKRIDDGDGSEKMPKESISNKRKAEKERRENLKQLRAESQRLLRETRDAAFKPIPLVQKPISSILDKIRQRKLEILKKSNASFDNNDDSLVGDDDSEQPCPGEEITDKIEKAELEETPAPCPAVTENDLNTSHIDGSNDAVDCSSRESIPSPTAVGLESEHAFRAPIGDTQELFSDSQMSDTNDEAVNEKLNNPSEEVFAPSMFAMSLKLDSVPPDDDDSSDDEVEDNDKENIDPHLHRSVDLTLPSGDPVKAFVDEEAEEEDDSDNDLQRFQDNEEEGEDDDEELNDMIATGYEEKPVDREKRDQLHQQWLEQQDTAGMDNLLQKLNCGSKLKESTSIEEEDEESKETENESDYDEVEDYIAPSEAVKMNLKKVKQMIPQMFTDKDEAYVSSEDEETEERLAKECLFYKAEETAKFFSPAEDESSREVFSLIKKLNIVPDTKRKGRTSIFDMPRIGQNINVSSKSSFVGRASNHFMPSTQKYGSSKVRSFIFGRDDSNSRTSVSMSEDSSDTIQKESQPPKAVSAKFQRNTQNKYATLNSTSQKSNVSLFEILRSSSLHKERSVQNTRVQQKESVFDAFKLAKKPIKTEARG